MTAFIRIRPVGAELCCAMAKLIDVFRNFEKRLIFFPPLDRKYEILSTTLSGLCYKNFT